jgi:hypothetical protein
VTTTYEAMLAAIEGAYDATPNGEGRTGAIHCAALAAMHVANGMTPSDAVSNAIGDRGIYGVPRTHALVPRADRVKRVINSVTLHYGQSALADECERNAT